MRIIIYISLLLSFSVSAMDIKEYLIDYNIKKSLNIKVKEKHYKKQNVTVGILDSGYDENIRAYKKIASVGNSIKDYEDHGAHVLGIYLAINKDSKVLVEKQTDMKSYLRGLKRLIDKDVSVINISAIGFKYDLDEYRLLKRAQEKGIVVVVSAGNEGRKLDNNFKMYPASYDLDNIIVVANYANKESISVNSNYGKETVDIGIIGENILSYCNRGICKKTGTSQSAPIISALIIKLKQKYKGIGIPKIKHILSINSHKNGWTKYGFLYYNSLIGWINNNEGV